MFLSQTTLSHIFKVMLYSRASERTWVLNRQNKAEYKGVHAYSGGQNYEDAWLALKHAPLCHFI